MPPADNPEAQRLPTLVLVASAAVSAAEVLVGVRIGSGIGTWLACCAGAGWVLSAGGIVVARRLASRPQTAGWKDRPTGNTLQPCSFPEVPPATFRWVGGCNVPGKFGRLNATFPGAVLDVGP